MVLGWVWVGSWLSSHWWCRRLLGVLVLMVRVLMLPWVLMLLLVLLQRPLPLLLLRLRCLVLMLCRLLRCCHSSPRLLLMRLPMLLHSSTSWGLRASLLRQRPRQHPAASSRRLARLRLPRQMPRRCRMPSCSAACRSWLPLLACSLALTTTVLLPHSAAHRRWCELACWLAVRQWPQQPRQQQR